MIIAVSIAFTYIVSFALRCWIYPRLITRTAFKGGICLFFLDLGSNGSLKFLFCFAVTLEVTLRVNSRVFLSPGMTTGFVHD